MTDESPYVSRSSSFGSHHQSQNPPQSQQTTKATTTSRHFPDSILGRHDVVLWGRLAGNGYDAGVIANRSDDCVGMSNVFGDQAMADAAILCARSTPGLPLTGYAWGDELIEAVNLGFETCGRLRVWVSP